MMTVSKCDNHAEHICAACVMHGNCKQEIKEHFDMFMNRPELGDAAVGSINYTAQINMQRYGAVVYSGIVG